MKVLILLAVAITSAGCASNNNRYLDSSFELCQDGIDVYSVSDDGKTRIACTDGSRFIISDQDEFDHMREINATYCGMSGLFRFHSSNGQYTFSCKSGERISVPVGDI